MISSLRQLRFRLKRPAESHAVRIQLHEQETLYERGSGLVSIRTGVKAAAVSSTFAWRMNSIFPVDCRWITFAEAAGQVVPMITMPADTPAVGGGLRRDNGRHFCFHGPGLRGMSWDRSCTNLIGGCRNLHSLHASRRTGSTTAPSTMRHWPACFI